MPECWHDRRMPTGPTLEITAELVNALRAVLDRDITTLDPIVLLARYVDELAKSFGLSEHDNVSDDPLERVKSKLRLPADAAELVKYFLPESGAKNADAIRQRLYDVFVQIDSQGLARFWASRRRPRARPDLLEPRLGRREASISEQTRRRQCGGAG